MKTLFHEFGHGLHHMLTQVDDLGVSGINGVEWDAVELPSQFMENFCWEWHVLDVSPRHDETGEPLPAELFDKISPRATSRPARSSCASSSSPRWTCELHHRFDPAQRRLQAC